MTTAHGFELLRERALPALSSTARLHRHVATGAELLSLLNDDENKVFGISFATPPRDSTGIAHILEHSVLCGSRKYPVKDPFVQLMKGSLNTFLNAMTFPDKTCYPVASQNLQDFYNLIDVYLDAVFHPRITPEIFQQEGWHYEMEAIDAPLDYKGVVFNEMKGNYSSPTVLLSELSRQSLFPDITYGFDVGGDPRRIPDLTYAQFKHFHEQHYHPSNARLFFYGDDDPLERLRLLDAYLREFKPIAINWTVPLQARFAAPRRLIHAYAAAEAEEHRKAAMLTMNWMLDEVTDVESRLALNILEHILIGTPASPLRKALIDSGLGEDLAGGGLEDELRQPMFSTGLKGIDPADEAKIEKLILDTLDGLARNGIDRATLEASLNTVEFGLRENNTGSFPRGIALMLRALKPWLHRRDPIEPLAFEGPLDAIKSRAAEGRTFESLIARCFLANPHRTTVVLRPDHSRAEQEAAEERARLEEARAAMDREAAKAVVENAARLRRLQETPDPPEALATIPTLKLEDLPRLNKRIPREVSALADTRVLFHEQSTNGIVYLDLGFDLHTLSADLLPYVALFSRALLETGAGAQDFVELSQRIGRATGGIWPQFLLSAIRGSQIGATWMFLRGKAMPERTGELLAILRDVILAARLDDRERLRQLVLEEKASQQERLVPMGSYFVNMRLRSDFHEAAWAAEQMAGISYFFFLRDLAKRIETDWDGVHAALERIRRTLLHRGTMICNVTVDAGNFRSLKPQLAAFLGTLPREPAAPASWNRAQSVRDEGLTIPAQVNYVGKGANLFRLGYQPSGATHVVEGYLSSTWLWEKIRVQGGAYGGSCRLDSRSGGFTFLSYRDPNLLPTLEVYDRTAGFLRSADVSPDELRRNIIGKIGDFDTYLLPDAKGFTSTQWYLTNETDEIRQRMREQVLAASAADFRNFAEVLDEVAKAGRVVVLGSQEAVERANAERPGLLTMTCVL
jgi:Zn-dependent M16 (insulinase) family peptidase